MYYNIPCPALLLCSSPPGDRERDESTSDDVRLPAVDDNANDDTENPTMQRRKFVIGMGALASGAAAAMGTGAFNVARSDRDIEVDIVDDSDAYLGLEATSKYAADDGGELELAFDGSLDDQNGDGLSEDANYVFTDVFAIRNNGTDEIAVTLSDSEESIGWDTEYPRAYYSFEELGTTNDVTGDGDFTGGTAADEAYLETGESLYVHFEFVGREAELDDGRDDKPDTIGVYAEARD